MAFQGHRGSHFHRPEASRDVVRVPRSAERTAAQLGDGLPLRCREDGEAHGERWDGEDVEKEPGRSKEIIVDRYQWKSTISQDFCEVVSGRFSHFKVRRS